MRNLSAFIVTIAWLPSIAAGNEAFRHPFSIVESLEHRWDADLVHHSFKVAKPGVAFADRLQLSLEQQGKSVPLAMQLDRIKTYPDGSLESADVWFRTDLPANGKKQFALTTAANGAANPLASALKIVAQGEGFELSNNLTAVRVPQLNVQMWSGAWAAGIRVAPPAGQTVKQSTTSVAQGPIFIRTRTTYVLSGGGSYVSDVTLRDGEPFVRVEETFEKAGQLELDLSTGLSPTKFATKDSYRGNMQLTPINYAQENQLPRLVSWDEFLPDRTSVIGYLGGPADDVLAWIATEDAPNVWMPHPDQNSFFVTAQPGGKLKAVASLEKGRRNWGLFVGKGRELPNPGKDLYLWWTRHIVASLDRVANWQLEWPGMDEIKFPHTLFSKEDLPSIRERLRAEPTVRAFLEKLRTSDDENAFNLNQLPGELKAQSDPKIIKRLEDYRDRILSRGGLLLKISQLSAAALYFGDDALMDQLADRHSLLGTRFAETTGPEAYADFFLYCYLDDAGTFGQGMERAPMRYGLDVEMLPMQVSDMMLLRCVAFELLLGSDKLTPQAKHRLLSKLAFMTYVMHLPEWQPPVHFPDGTRAGCYPQGTENQKHCAFAVRAMTACMLQNHPLKPDWMKFAMAELRPHYESSIAESGALVESPFYSSRDTMRYGPFWLAMTRAGVKEVAPDYEKWMNRPKNGFQYLANMLTPKEPRMGGKRVYHPIGRSSPGVIDQTFMIGGDPWAKNDPQHGELMRWCWMEQGKPSPDSTGTTGGRNIALTLLAFAQSFPPSATTPLTSRRFEGMGVQLRSQVQTNFESNVLFRHDPFCWDLYAVNNGAVYFYGKGAPLLPRFGAYWSHSYGGAWMMELPFGNRVEFASGDNSETGHMTEFTPLGSIADLSVGEAADWRRSVLFAKDLDRDDPVYLLVRDDVSRAGSASTLNWWVMTKNVAPQGLTAPGVVPIATPDQVWVNNLGSNWKDAPELTGQFHHFPGMCDVDLDMFIATPQAPQIVTDAASSGKFPYCETKDLFETQQLIRVSQPAEQGYLTLLVPRLPGSPEIAYQTIADGSGVKIQAKNAPADFLFLSDKPVSFKDGTVAFSGRNGFARKDRNSGVRLMVIDGQVAYGGITLRCKGTAAIRFDGKTVHAYSPDPKSAEIQVDKSLGSPPIHRE